MALQTESLLAENLGVIPVLQETLSFTSILEIHSLSIGAQHLLLALLSYRNRATGRCNPRIDTICDRLGKPRRTVERWMRELRTAGYLDATRNGRASSYSFSIDIKTCGKPVGRSDMDGASRSATGGVSDTPKMADQDGPHPYMNRSTEPTKVNGAADVKATGIVEPAEKAAAAAPPAVQESFNFEHPASPPVERMGARPAAAHSGPIRVQPLSPPVEKTANRDNHLRDAAKVVEAPIQLSDPSGQLPRLEIVPRPKDDIPVLAAALADKLIDVHPQPGLPNRVAPLIETILRNAADPLATAERIWENHRVWRDYWARLEAGKFIPQLWRWFKDGEWTQPPVIRKPAQRATLTEQTMEKIRQRKAAGLWRD